MFARALKIAVAFVVAALLFVPIPTAEAAKAAPHSSLALVVLDGPDATPNWGEHVTFDVVAPVDEPYVQIKCYQGDQIVYVAKVGYFPAWPYDSTFTLSSSQWTGGAAECFADLYSVRRNFHVNTYAEITFSVLA